MIQKQQQKGFTLIELIIAMAMMSILTVIVLANYRTADRLRRVQLASDNVISALTDAQNASLTGKKGTGCGGSVAYSARFVYSANTITMGCGTGTIQKYSLPANTRIKNRGITINGSVVSNGMFANFMPPFGSLQACSINSAGSACSPAAAAFSNAVITVESSDNSSVYRTITIDGVSGRIQ